MRSDEKSAQSDSSAAASAVAAAESAATEAAVRAREARAQATRLRRRAKTLAAGQHRHRMPKQRRRLRLRLPRWRQLGVAVGVLLIAISSAASGSMWWQHRIAAGQRQLAAEFAAAGRQAADVLLTLDYTKAAEHIQRVLDNSTGTFKSGFEKNATRVIERMERSKVVASTEVKDAAVQSMSDDAGVVLVAAQTEATETDGQSQVTSWRLALRFARDGGRLKISDVEFVE